MTIKKQSIPSIAVNTIVYGFHPTYYNTYYVTEILKDGMLKLDDGTILIGKHIPSSIMAGNIYWEEVNNNKTGHQYFPNIDIHQQDITQKLCWIIEQQQARNTIQAFILNYVTSMLHELNTMNVSDMYNWIAKLGLEDEYDIYKELN